jgi:superfamily II DNA or RNA helicase
MSITLFEHNKSAYEVALTMLKTTKKAAIVHPTGTGKSFIGFKLCEDFPNQTVCWLSPSEYIFKTQIENLKKTSNGYEPVNIKFFTYAKLMLMKREELEKIHPDYIILDEFHRCGAKMWGEGVLRLLNCYSNTPILGLSATNIRYLDNQRNMTEELFDGNVASEMSLGEAIVRGILHPPKYVLSIFSYQNDLERYEQRVQSAKSKVVRDEAFAILEELRRALEQAEGMEEIFYTYMPQKNGKYIVFCSNFIHMQQMIEKVPEWFSKVDLAPHIYSIYSEDPETSKSFADFKSDESEHLKLLFCIDMLNEGIHVEGISGVILLRPTVSPIVYKQQIGRALSTNESKEVVIFDIVLNIENLYSIGTIEEEMQLAVNYYHSHGMDEKIVHEHFQIIGEVRNCMALFERLNDSLTASWSLMYQIARKYYEENGNLEVPKRYLTPDGYSLGTWIRTQRQVYANRSNGILTDKQIEMLDEIGMRWESSKELNWEKNFDVAKRYYQEHGNLLVPIDDKTGGISLGRWIAQLRHYRKNHIRSVYLMPERMKALDEIGMVWDVHEYLWEQNFKAATKYYRENGNLEVPSAYIDEDGVRLGAWLFSIKTAKKQGELSKEQEERLQEIGMVWKEKQSLAWEKSYQAVCKYKEKYGDLNIPVAYVSDDGYKIGKWLRRQREAYKKGMSDIRKRKLDEIGMVWEAKDPWNTKFEMVKEFYGKYGHVKIPRNYVVEGVWISRWLSEQVARLNGKSKVKKELSKEQIQKLESVGISKF